MKFAEQLWNGLKKIKQVHLFYLVLLVNVAILFSVKLYPSLDGPAHLYNSKLIYHLIKGDNEAINNFFTFNAFPVPNWVDHIVMAFFYFIAPFWLVEKAYIIVYLIGLSVSFRLLVRQLNPSDSGLSILIFPFVYNYLFRMGFYNNTISFVFLFFALYYWLKTREKRGLKKYFVLFVLFTLTYFSNVLTFLFLGLVLGLFTFLHAFSAQNAGVKEPNTIKNTALQLTGVFIAALPALTLLILFTLNTEMSPFNSSHDFEYSTDDLIKWLNDVKSLIVYVYPEEAIISRQFVHIMIAALACSLLLRTHQFKQSGKGIKELFQFSDSILLVALFALVLLFIIPDGQGAGMMSDRYCLLFFMFSILWIAVQPIPRGMANVLVILTIVAHFDLLAYQMKQAIVPLSKDAELIQQTAQHIEANSIVLPVNFTDNWLEGHLGDYVGVDKPIVVLENYEATIGWFPLKWNFDKMPLLLLGEKPPSGDLLWINNTYAPTKKQIDYVMIYGYAAKLKEAKWATLDSTLTASYNLIYASNNYYINLYKKK